MNIPSYLKQLRGYVETVLNLIFSKISMLILLACILLFGLYFAFNNPYWADGDELHYLIMSQSVVQDRDFSLQNEYDNKEYFEYHGFEVEPHAIATVNGELRSWHDIGLPIIVSPGYYLGKMQFVRTQLFAMFAISLAVLFYYLILSGFTSRVSLITTTLYALQFPIMAYSQYAYTDMMGSYVITTGLVLLLFYSQSNLPQRIKPVILFSASLFFALSLFIHAKLIIVALLIIIGWNIYNHWGRFVSIFSYLKSKNVQAILPIGRYIFFENIILTLPIFAAIVFKSYLHLRWFGQFSYSVAITQTLQQSGISDSTLGAFSGNPIISFFGLFMDGDYGLLVHAPLFILLFPGLVLLLKSNRKILWYVVLVPLLGLIAVQLNWVVWRSWGPPARYLILALMPLAVSYAQSIDVLIKKWWGLIILSGISVWSLLMTLQLWNNTKYGYPSYGGYNFYTNSLLEKFRIGWISRIIFIDMVNPLWTDWLKVGIVSVGIIILTVLMYETYQNDKIDNRKRLDKRILTTLYQLFTRITQLQIKNVLTRQIATKFGIGFALNNVINLAGMFLLTDILGLWYRASFIIVRTLQTLFGFGYNSKVLFNSQATPRRYIIYLCVVLFIEFLNYYILVFFTEFIGVYYIVSMIVSLSITVGLKYMMYYLFVFNQANLVPSHIKNEAV